MPEQTDFMRTDPIAEITQLFDDWGFLLDHENRPTRAFKGKVKKTLHARKADKSGHPYANLRNAIEECLFKYGADKIETEIKQPGLISDYVTISVFTGLALNKPKCSRRVKFAVVTTKRTATNVRSVCAKRLWTTLRAGTPNPIRRSVGGKRWRTNVLTGLPPLKSKRANPLARSLLKMRNADGTGAAYRIR